MCCSPMNYAWATSVTRFLCMLHPHVQLHLHDLHLDTASMHISPTSNRFKFCFNLLLIDRLCD